MADISKEVRIAFEGDDRVSKVISGISGQLDSFVMRMGLSARTQKCTSK
jgi:hypothetical protein